MFWCFDTSMSTSDSLQNNLRRKPSLIIVTDVNMTLKRAFLQKVTVLLNSTAKKRGLTRKNKLFLVFFFHNHHHGLCLAQNQNRKYRRSACTCIFQNLSKLPLSSRLIRMSDSNNFFRCYQTDKMSINKSS